MKHVEVATNLLRPRQPTFLILFVTSRCNAGCSFCFYADRVSAPSGSDAELSADEYRMISERCGRIPYLLLSGGEPLLRDDLTSIVGSFIQNAGARFVNMPSNGMLPDRMRDTFDELTAKYPGTHFRAALSVDFPDERHDAMREREGCLDRLLESAALIRELRGERRNLTLDVVTVFLPGNSGELTQLHSWVEENIAPDNHELHILRAEWPSILADGIDADEFMKALRYYRGKARKSENRWMSSGFRGLTDMWMRIMERLIRGDRIFPCHAGSKIVVVDETGKVRLCELRPELLGDLREYEYSLKRIIRSRSSDELRRCMNAEKCTCTWECAMIMNILMSPKMYPGLIRSTFSEMIGSRRVKR